MEKMLNNRVQSDKAEIKTYITDLEGKLRNCVATPVPEEKLRKIIDAVSKVTSGEESIDLTDIAAVTAAAKTIYVGSGDGKGDNMAENAARTVFADLNCSTALSKITNAIILMDSSEDVELENIEKLAELIQEKLPDDVITIFSANFDAALENEMRVTVLLTE